MRVFYHYPEVFNELPLSFDSLYLYNDGSVYLVGNVALYLGIISSKTVKIHAAPNQFFNPMPDNKDVKKYRKIINKYIKTLYVIAKVQIPHNNLAVTFTREA